MKFYKLKSRLKKQKKRDKNCLAFYIKKYKKNYTLISTSTPLGNSSFIKASIVLDEDE